MRPDLRPGADRTAWSVPRQQMRSSIRRVTRQLAQGRSPRGPSRLAISALTGKVAPAVGRALIPGRCGGRSAHQSGCAHRQWRRVDLV